jgi:hypothetical protein
MCHSEFSSTPRTQAATIMTSEEFLACTQTNYCMYLARHTLKSHMSAASVLKNHMHVELRNRFQEIGSLARWMKN